MRYLCWLIRPQVMAPEFLLSTPIFVLSELDAQGVVARQIEIYIDGSYGLVNGRVAMGSSYTGVPEHQIDISDVADSTDAMHSEVSADVFDLHWENANARVR
jgi:hypothetical protein